MRDRSKHGSKLGLAGIPARRATRRRREGSVAITIVLLLGVIFGMVGLSLDAGQIYKVRTQAQNAADATALAAAAKLDGTDTGITNARDQAVSFAGNNRVYSGGAVVDPADVVFGRWSPATGVFTEFSEAEVTRINAVRVRITPAEVDNPFMGVFGRDETDVNAIAIASAGGAAAECSSPLVLADCMPAGGEMSGGNCGTCLKFQDATDDTAGWTNLGSGSVSTGTISDLLKSTYSNLVGGCDDYDDTATECSGACTAPTVDTDVGLYNGNGLNEGGATYGADNCGANLNNPCEVVKEILLREADGELAVDADGNPIMVDGVQALKGKYFTLTVPLFDDDHGGDADSECDPQFSGSAPIEGYTKIDIFSVQCHNAGGAGGGKGKDGEEPAPAAKETVLDPDYMEAYASELASLSCDTVPSGKHLLGRVYCDSVVGPGGGGMPGRTATRPRLVQ